MTLGEELSVDRLYTLRLLSQYPPENMLLPSTLTASILCDQTLPGNSGPVNLCDLQIYAQIYAECYSRLYGILASAHFPHSSPTFRLDVYTSEMSKALSVQARVRGLYYSTA